MKTKVQLALRSHGLKIHGLKQPQKIVGEKITIRTEHSDKAFSCVLPPYLQYPKHLHGIYPALHIISHLEKAELYRLAQVMHKHHAVLRDALLSICRSWYPRGPGTPNTKGQEHKFESGYIYYT